MGEKDLCAIEHTDILLSMRNRLISAIVSQQIRFGAYKQKIVEIDCGVETKSRTRSSFYIKCSERAIRYIRPFCQGVNRWVLNSSDIETPLILRV